MLEHKKQRSKRMLNMIWKVKNAHGIWPCAPIDNLQTYLQTGNLNETIEDLNLYNGLVFVWGQVFSTFVILFVIFFFLFFFLFLALHFILSAVQLCVCVCYCTTALPQRGEHCFTFWFMPFSSSYLCTTSMFVIFYIINMDLLTIVIRILCLPQVSFSFHECVSVCMYVCVCTVCIKEKVHNIIIVFGFSFFFFALFEHFYFA